MTVEARDGDQSSITAPTTPPVQNTASEQVHTYRSVDQIPEPEGGMRELARYVETNFHHPAIPGAAKVTDLEGTVFVSFVVTKNGQVTNVHIAPPQESISSFNRAEATQPEVRTYSQPKIEQGIDDEVQRVLQAINQEAIRVTRAMPDWQPGKKDGQPVNVSCVLPVTYLLNPDIYYPPSETPAHAERMFSVHIN